MSGTRTLWVLEQVAATGAVGTALHAPEPDAPRESDASPCPETPGAAGAAVDCRNCENCEPAPVVGETHSPTSLTDDRSCFERPEVPVHVAGPAPSVPPSSANAPPDAVRGYETAFTLAASPTSSLHVHGPSAGAEGG